MWIAEDEARGTFRVDRRVYTDPELWQRERAQIFARCWLYAAHASELPNNGDFVTRTIFGRPLIIARGPDGVVRAMVNSCTHRGAMICKQPSGNAKAFRCPYHAWTYETTGSLRAIPGSDAYGPHFTISDWDLKSVRLESYRDFLFVTYSVDAGSLHDYLAGARAYLDLVIDQSLGAGMEVVSGAHRYGTRANWKLLAENSTDTYHVAALHGRYLSHIAGQGARGPIPRGHGYQLGNGHAVSMTWPPVSAKPVACWGPPMPESRREAMTQLQQRLVAMYGDDRAHQIGQTYRQLLIFPNLAIHDTCATTIRTWEPLGADAIDVSAWCLAPRGQAEEDRALELAAYVTFFGPGGFATPDDIDIMESCQRAFVATEVQWADCSRGMHRDAPGAYDELQVRAFWRRWQELMTGEPAAGTR
jgi:benzoate/toluate 1,2-dioxygenase alpha subunit/p-cumate 2,3-dioxygenase alpha subunit